MTPLAELLDVPARLRQLEEAIRELRERPQTASVLGVNPYSINAAGETIGTLSGKLSAKGVVFQEAPEFRLPPFAFDSIEWRTGGVTIAGESITGTRFEGGPPGHFRHRLDINCTGEWTEPEATAGTAALILEAPSEAEGAVRAVVARAGLRTAKILDSAGVSEFAKAEAVSKIESGETLVSLIEKALANQETKVLSATQNNWAVGPIAFLEVESAAVREIRGIVAPAAERPGFLMVRLKGAATSLEFRHENVNATTTNRIYLSLQTTERLRLGYTCILVYDHKIERWTDLVAISEARVVSVSVAPGVTEAALVHNLNTTAPGVTISNTTTKQHGLTRAEANITSLEDVTTNEWKVVFGAETTQQFLFVFTG